MRIKFIIATIFTAFLMQGCDDQLDILPNDNISSETLYKTEAGALAGLAGAYSRVLQVYRDAIINGQYPTGWTDEGFYKRKGLQNIIKNNFTASDPVLGRIWAQYYEGVAAANSLLIGVRNSELDEAVKLEYEAEARFLRGFLYFDIQKAFGGIQGIPMPLEAEFITKELLPRTPGIDVYRQIIADLEFAEKHLPTATEAIGGRGNKSAARGLIARAYIFMATAPFNEAGAYEKAAAWSKKVIDDPYHELNPQYQDVFNELGRGNYETKETLFQIGFSLEGINPQLSNLGSGFGMLFEDENCATKGARLKGKAYGNTFANVTLVLKYRSDPDDERGLWNTLPFYNKRDGSCTLQLESSQFSYAASKYRRFLEPDPTFNSWGSHHWPVIRLSEMYLIYAEALVNTDPAKALKAVNDVRNRANATPLTAISDEAIQEEYLLELCFEGHRKFDLVRWGILEETVYATRDAVRALEADTSFMNEDWVTFGEYSLDANDIPIIDTTNPTNTVPRRNTMSTNWSYYEGYEDFVPSKNYILPIPAQELGVNTNLKQTTGW
ncbi:RagB/SusD family nutrient uptake outer membrane protein [Polaribacter sp. IC073]|uniref:RagB/SusD family nutrient uptake outer membrane protein n=1 Tax=Polaribacter sp. IC073 TaxID=2508540 RepID=UPI0011BDCD3C|nr:RagB/SusD family nutrient uptake outer membrane protein [Polaribacter sp. IC073]TXD46759.1 RagB/SusD family nutrient uptake outer membrane protein [Polaribacter sp. IC073]